MFENDSIHAFQRTTPQRAKMEGITNMSKQVKDDFIMDTNSSSIVSKRSVEKLYYPEDSQYYRHFVSKFKRRSPLINRGYYVRMRAIENAVQHFLEEPTAKRKIVINLGCGYDPLPWLFLGRFRKLCDNAKFVDVDYAQLMHKKVKMIERTPELLGLLPGLSLTSLTEGVLCNSQKYAAVGCDLHNLDLLRLVLKEQLEIDTCSIAILFVAEVSIAYMDRDGSQAVLEWAASYDDVRFCLLEQHLPAGRDHPFAETMLKHFQKLRTPLHAIGTISEMRARFEEAGWPKSGLDIRSMWDLWQNDLVSLEEKKRIDSIEPFDEWEEFALFCAHYFVMIARKGTGKDQPLQTKRTHSGSSLGTSIVCRQSTEASTQRRFAAVILPAGSELEQTSFALLHGLGTRERLGDTATYVTSAAFTAIAGPPIREGLMCHTVTQLDSTTDCLLVGGRASPSRASAECWLRASGEWHKVQDLPQGRYRHCAVPVLTAEESGILIHGGRTSTGEVLSDFLLWTKTKGWTQLSCKVILSPRFGAVLTVTSKNEGLLIGGMDDNYSICEDAWSWRLNDQHDGQITLREQPAPLSALHRFGAQTTRWTFTTQEQLPPDVMLVGGIGLGGVLGREAEIFNVTQQHAHPLKGAYPLLIGASFRDRCSFGGGATCFSFGTFWNTTYTFEHDSEQNHIQNWQLSLPAQPIQKMLVPTENHIEVTSIRPVEVIDGPLPNPEHFTEIIKKSQPCVLRGCDIGQCTSLWTPQYLKQALGNRKVVVHLATKPRMDFQAKNFRYETRPFIDFMDAVLAGELLYLRALSSQGPSEKPTQLALDYPEIADDFILPPELAYVNDNAHSSPLRISGKTIMWLHYDVMANVLCQISGKKTLMLYPPSDIAHLELEAGMSSSSLDVFGSDAETHPSLRCCHPYRAELQSGDILFIPSLWLHAAAPTEDLSVAVNVFFRHLKDGYAAGKDVYGNRDLAAYERGRRDVAKIIKSMAQLPLGARDHYLSQLSLELQRQPSSTQATHAIPDEGIDLYTRARKDVARIIKSFANLTEEVKGFYLRRLALEVEHARGG